MVFSYASAEKPFTAITAFCAIMLPSRSITADQTDSSHWFLFACYKTKSVWVWDKKSRPTNATQSTRRQSKQSRLPSVRNLTLQVDGSAKLVANSLQPLVILFTIHWKNSRTMSLEQTEMDLPKKNGVLWTLYDEVTGSIIERLQLLNSSCLLGEVAGSRSYDRWKAQLTQDFDVILALLKMCWLHPNNKLCIKMNNIQYNKCMSCIMHWSK